MAAEASFKSVYKKLISQRAKHSLDKTLILAVMTRSSETWLPNKSVADLLDTFERKAVRKVTGSILQN